MKRLNRARLLILLSPYAWAGCLTPGPAFDDWHGKVYMGNPEKQIIERRQAGEFIQCDDPDFGAFVCMTKADFMGLVSSLIARECVK